MKLLGWLFAFILALAATDGHASTGNLFQRVGSAGGGGTISGSLAGMDGSGLLIDVSGSVPTSQTMLRDLLGWKIPVTSMGAIADGQPHVENLRAAYAAHALASTPAAQPFGVVVQYPGNLVMGTSTTLNAEHPIYISSNTTVEIEGVLTHNINSSEQALFTTACNSDGCTSTSATSIAVHGLPGSRLDYTYNGGQSKKMVSIGNANDVDISGLNVSTTAPGGSYTLQCRNTKRCYIHDNNIALISGGPASGQDGIHFSGWQEDGRAWNNTCRAHDDCLSYTEENNTMAHKTMVRMLAYANTLLSSAHSAIKLFVGNSAVSGTIQVTFANNYLGSWGNLAQANCIVVDNEVGFISAKFTGKNYCDATLMEPSPGGPLVDVTNDLGYTDATVPAGVVLDLGDSIFEHYKNDGLIIRDGIKASYNGLQVIDYIGEQSILSPTGVASIRRTGTDTMQVYYPSGTDLSGVTTSHLARITSTTYPSNTATFAISSVSDPSDTITLTSSNVSSSTDEVGANEQVAIVYRPGTAFECKGCSNGDFKNGYFSNPPGYAINPVVNGTIKPLNNNFEGNIFDNQSQMIGLAVSAGYGNRIVRNHCRNFSGDRCISVTSSANVSNTFGWGNDDDMTPGARDSFRWSDTDGRTVFLNFGSSNQYFEFLNQNTVSASAGLFTSATIATSLTVGNISATTGPSKLINVSVTQNVSVTGNLSAGLFIGDGSGLTNISATASPGGSANQVQYNTGTATGGATGITYNSTTLETSFTGNVIGANGVSGSRIMGTNAGTCSANTIQVNAANNGFYRPASNQVGGCAGGTEALRLTSTAVSTSLNMTIGGTISTSLAGATSRSLCVSPNGAIYASPTCP
ncbi:hypothetical protein [Bradyrhizobium manausense]|uniref:hypothetical protein n=1 Tax=Bradyrhizobium manausense TaxID=989370 RepID=UPI001BADD958|nr:hypothetical protein [Bradyrhizobium manausense]MBR0721760.1 hypothetical protein [Bradyrhizobium manausense]